MYAMLCTRPDLAFTISQISQFSSNPSTIHESAAKRALRYLNGTRNLGITFDGNRGLVLEGYSDADWGAGKDRKSISGYVFTLAGGAISWSSKKQATTALSTTEAEYIALVQVAKESIWIQGLLDELGFTVTNSNLIYGDNQGSIGDRSCKQPRVSRQNQAYRHSVPLYSRMRSKQQNRPQILPNSRHGGRWNDQSVGKGKAYGFVGEDGSWSNCGNYFTITRW